MIDFQTRIKKLDELPENLQELYLSADTGTILREVFSQHNITEDKYDAYVATVSCVILGFYKISELPTQLVADIGLQQQTAQSITSNLIELLTPAINHYEGKNASNKAQMGKLADQFAARSQKPAVSEPETIPDTAAVTRSLSDLKPVPKQEPLAVTTETQEEPVYQTSQDSVIENNHRIANGSVYNPEPDATKTPPPANQPNS